MKPPVIPFVPLILKGESRFQAMFLSTLSMPHSDRPSIPSQFSSVCGYKERSPQDECGLGEGRALWTSSPFFVTFICICVCVCVCVCGIYSPAISVYFFSFFWDIFFFCAASSLVQEQSVLFQ